MKPTPEMIAAGEVAAATEAHRRATLGVPGSNRHFTEVVLTAGLSPYEAPPFKLFTEELYVHSLAGRHELDCDQGMVLSNALDRAIRTLGVAQAAPVAGKHECEWDQTQQVAISELLDTLDIIDCQLYSNAWTYMLEQYVARKAADVRSVVMVAPLTSDERFELEDCRSMHSHGIAVSDRKLDALLRITESRFPKPDPIERTNEDLYEIVCSTRDIAPEHKAALQELVRRANAGKVAP